MDFSKISKALAGGLLAATGGVGTASIVVPADAGMPWWGYVVVGVLNFAIGFGGVYLAPANKPASP